MLHTYHNRPQVEDGPLANELSTTARVLLNTLALNPKDPTKYGFYYIGGGAAAIVYGHSKTPDVVYKMVNCGCMSWSKSGEDRPMIDGYWHYVQYIWAHIKSCGEVPDFLPRVYARRGGHSVDVYAMERLVQYKRATTLKDKAFLGAFNLNIKYKQLIHSDTVWGLREFAYNFYEFFRGKLRDDIHKGNVLRRPSNNSLVLTDPFYGVFRGKHKNNTYGRSLTRRWARIPGTKNGIYI